MPQSLADVYVHIVFSTKNRNPQISDEIRLELHAYIAQILNTLKCSSHCINSVDDHIHILTRLTRTHSIADILKEIKKCSSKWIKSTSPEFKDFAWQAGYGIFAVSHSNLAQVQEYINKQAEHHQHKTFQEEYHKLLEKHDLNYDERYLWD